MKMNIFSKKSVQALLALMLVFVVVLGATFAWQSFNQRKRNVFTISGAPDVNLHDDFDAPNKDVYVENSGITEVFVRVRLAEYMEIAEVSILPSANAEDKDTWEPHSFTTSESGGEDNCVLCKMPQFHEYYTWVMGGQKYYKPATEEQKSAGALVDKEGNPVLDENGDPIPAREATVVQDEWEKYSKYAEAVTAKTAEVDASSDPLIVNKIEKKLEELKAMPENSGKPDADLRPAALKAVALEELSLKETQNAYVYSMDEWANGTAAVMNGEAIIRPALEKNEIGSFWVLDVDGWAYWGSSLQAGKATGLLLNQVDRTQKEPSSNTYYAIDVWLQAVTKDDMGQFGIAPNSITANAKNLLELATGDFVIADDGKKYFDNGNNIFNEVLADGSYGKNICGGADGIPGNTDDVKANDKITIDGTEYPINGFVTGADGNGYIDLGNGKYACSVDENGSITELGKGKGYKVTYAGADETIGTEDDESYRDNRDNTFTAILMDGSDGKTVCGGLDRLVATEDDRADVVVGNDGTRLLGPDENGRYQAKGADGLLGTADDVKNLVKITDEMKATNPSAEKYDKTYQDSGYMLEDEYGIYRLNFATPKTEAVRIGGIDWLVIDRDRNATQAKVISKYLLEKRKYGAGDSCTWAQSTMQTYLNGTFYNNLPPTLKKALVSQTIDTVANTRLYIPTLTEIQSWFPTQTSRIAYMVNSSTVFKYALRSTGSSTGMTLMNMVNEDGRTDQFWSADLDAGMRPAAVISLN